MSRRNLHNDENFWPCVSDMFLALFVIALVLYSTMSADKGRGDEYISDLAAQEACSLFETLKREYPGSETLQSIDVDEILEEEHGTRPKLAEALYSLLSCAETTQYFHVKDETLTKVPDDAAMYRYSDAIALLYEARTEGGCPPDESDPCYHEHMRMVREHVEREINKSKSGDVYSEYSHEDLVDKIRDLERQILYLIPKAQYDALNEKYQKLSKEGADPEKWRNKVVVKLAEQVWIKIRINVAKIILGTNDAVIKGNDGKIAALEDPRKGVMESVQEVLNQSRFAPLLKAGVQVKVNEGIIYIPSTVFKYPQAFITKEYNKGRGVVTSELREEFEKNLTDAEKKNLMLLAEFLSEIEKLVSSGKLAIDNIAIECYMVDTPSASNEGMILQCSFDAWRMLDMYAEGRLSGYKKEEGRLSGYKKEDGQGLFSMSGFIREKKNYEKPSGPHMQIRFNCSPKRAEEESASPN